MKKLFVLMMVVLLTLSLGGCGSKKPKETRLTCSTKVDELDFDFEVVVEGELVKTIILKNKLEVGSAFMSFAESIAEEYVEEFEEVKGFDYSYQADGDYLIQIFTIDLATVDGDDLVGAGIIDEIFREDVGELDIKTVKDSLEKMGCNLK